ncbi:hypothetical protein, partial [Paenibacillus larvae]|uniref:hypothetical protein n=1 Tax=Paenibacillus larvae TaxID=1464 RepID=UPI0022825002
TLKTHPRAFPILQQKEYAPIKPKIPPVEKSDDNIILPTITQEALQLYLVNGVVKMQKTL